MGAYAKEAIAIFSNKFGDAVAKNVKEEFRRIHLSGNLMDTLWVEKLNIGNEESISNEKAVVVHIPAVRYDIRRYREEGVVVHMPEEGSYAQAVNISGGFSHSHKGYVEEAITKAIATSIRSTQRRLGGLAKVKVVSVTMKF